MKIFKNLGIAAIIAFVTAPAFADIASTDYVDNIVNNVIPKSGTVGDVLKKTESGFEWAAAPTTTLETTTGQSTTAGMTQKAITDALNAKLSDNVADPRGAYTSIAIGKGATATNTKEDPSVALGGYASAGDGSVAVGRGARTGRFGVAIGYDSKASAVWATAVGYDAIVGEDADNSIQLGSGTVTEYGTLSVGLGDTDSNDNYISYPLLKSGGVIPAGRLVYRRYDEVSDNYVDNNGNNGDVLVSNGDGTMSWVNAADSVLPELINDCKVSGQRCALITTWNSTTNKPEYTWEVVKVNQ